MRRRGAALVEFGLVVGILIMLMSTVAAFYPAIATRTVVVDASLASALELSTYRAPSALALSGTRSESAQAGYICRNAWDVSALMMRAAGFETGRTPAGCGPASGSRPIGIELQGFALGPGSIPASPFTVCVTYRYAPSGGISYVLSSGPFSIDAENLTYIDLGACTAVYLDDDRTEIR